MKLNEIKNIQSRLKYLNDRLKKLKREESQTQELINGLLNGCNHDFLLIYGKSEFSFSGNVLDCICLVCNKSMVFDEYLDYESIESRNLIDITTQTPELHLLEPNDIKNVKEAQETFYKHLENCDGKTLASFKYDVEREILEKVVCKKLTKKINKRDDINE